MSTEALARATDPSTSHAAAASIEPTALEDRVLQCLRRNPHGLTSTEIAERLNLAPWTVSPRIKPMREKGLVLDSGIKRKGASGRSSIVWWPRLTP